MLRITSGTLRNRRIPMPKGEVRPTSERARQAFFDIIGERIRGARFLDLFAGSGAFAFEAVSRGAASAVAIDASRRNAAAIEKLAAEFACDVKAITADALAGITRVRGTVFDVIYADPPYDYAQYDALLAALDGDAGLAPDAIVAIEHRRRTDPWNYETRRLSFSRRAEYGEVWIDFFIT